MSEYALTDEEFDLFYEALTIKMEEYREAYPSAGEVELMLIVLKDWIKVLSNPQQVQDYVDNYHIAKKIAEEDQLTAQLAELQGA